uniref:RNase H type-1 domain-containing protein n=1 Tax=Cannabis sativa TaxID=3483 RepID=A0A803PFL5_CANSA
MGPKYIGKDGNYSANISLKVAWGSDLLLTLIKQCLPNKLAKQAWRLFDNPNSLLGRLLKHRYYPRNSFLEAHKGHSPSLTWQGIHWGRKLLLKGLRYKIGNGFHVISGLDPWIPGHDEFKPICYTRDPSTPVSTYILDTMEWNLPQLHQDFAQIDIDRILTIPLSFYQSTDRLIWHHNTNGFYSVKSSFHLATSISEKDQESSSDDYKTWWKFFWKLQLPPKVKIFAWKVIQNALPVATALHKRKVIDSTLCTRCKSAWESIGHALFSCKFAKSVWKNTKFQIDTHHAMENHNYQTRLSAHQHQQTDLNMRHQSTISTANDNILFQQTRDDIVWKPPPMNLLKMNVDAATNSKTLTLGIGAVVRNYKGEIMAALSKKVQGCFQSDEMEAKTLFHILNWASQNQMSITMVETDALRVSSALNSNHNDLSCFNDLITDARCLLSSFPRVTVTHARRQANQAAHGLAKYALELDEDVS